MELLKSKEEGLGRLSVLRSCVLCTLTQGGASPRGGEWRLQRAQAEKSSLSDNVRQAPALEKTPQKYSQVPLSECVSANLEDGGGGAEEGQDAKVGWTPALGLPALL